MKVTTKIIAVLIMLLLATPAILFEGCGTDGFCGGCPSDSVAPYRSSVTQPEDGTHAVSPGGSYCVNSLTFTIVDEDDNPLNGICVEVFTNGFVALSKVAGDCTLNSYVTYIRTRTDNGGTVTVDFLTDILGCSASTPSGETEDVGYFVQVNSCTAGALWSGTWTMTCP